jgi:hypothetical protein
MVVAAAAEVVGISVEVAPVLAGAVPALAAVLEWEDLGERATVVSAAGPWRLRAALVA